MADRTEGSIVIDADPARIMAVLTDYEAYPQWADVKDAQIRAQGEDGRAAQVYFEISAGPINAKYTLAYVYSPGDAGMQWSWVEGSGLKNIEGEYVLEPEGGGTKVTYRTAVDVSIPGPGFLKRKLLAEGEKRIIDIALKGLKKRVESQT